MLQIKEQFKQLIPPLTKEEFAQLENNCLAEGIREKIITWNGFIIDGHNRYQIAQKWNLDYQTESKSFKDENAVKEWMINNQFGRRNLSNYQRSVLALQLEEVFREKAKENLSKTGGNKKSGLQISAKPIIETVDTRKEVAKVANVSHDTIAKVKKIEAVAPEEMKTKLRTGEVSINQAYKEIKKEEKKQNFNQKKEEFEKPIEVTNTNQIILLGDSVEILPTLEKESFDLLLSDPPYGMDFKSGWSNKEKIANDKIKDTITIFENVLKECVPLLKHDAHFYLFGNLEYMPQIKPIIEKYLNLKNILIWDRKVIGMGDLKTYGKSFDIVYFGNNKDWKDLNGTRDRDVLQFTRVDPSKNTHPTEKPLDLLEYLIKKSTKENNKVLDPFAGGGSTLLACKKTNRMCTGIEIESKYYNLIKSRI
jgi:DNA modification methylase